MRLGALGLFCFCGLAFLRIVVLVGWLLLHAGWCGASAASAASPAAWYGLVLAGWWLLWLLPGCALVRRSMIIPYTRGTRK
eukprot:COSAG01_NODE_1549_length_9945_cov_568.576376_4_plen_81_part_00